MMKLLPARRAVLLSSLCLMIGAASADTGVTISNPQVSNDGTYVYYQFDYTGTPSFVRVFIDADQSPDSGYVKNGIGSEYLIENGVLFAYTGTGGNNWSWSKVGNVGYWTSDGKVRLKIDRSAINAPVSSTQADDVVFEVQDVSTSQSLAKLLHKYSRVTVPTLERFELVTEDGLQNGAQADSKTNTKAWSPNNDWGGHMSRVVTADDGTVYMLNLVLAGPDRLQEGWQLRKRSPVTGAWEAVASGLSLDEAHLLRSPKTGKIYVITHPDGKPAMGVEPSFAMQPIPGNWSQTTRGQRHYGNAGVGENGQICLKASIEGRGTGDTYTQYNCTTETSSGLSFAESTFASESIGNRSVYDYVFPGIAGSLFYTSSQSDLTKLVAQYPLYSGDYVFNGVNGFIFPGAHPRKVLAPLEVVNSFAAKVAPHLEEIEAYVDSKGRAFSIAVQQTTDGNTPLSQNTFVLSVTDPLMDGKVYEGTLAGLSTGSGRIVEDANKNLYVIWNYLFSSTNLIVYRLTETPTAVGKSTFTLIKVEDLSAKFAPFDKGWAYTRFVTSGRLYLSTPRGGTARSGLVDGYMNACNAEFTADGPRINGFTSPCFGDGKEQLKLVYFRIRLPD